MNPSSDEDNLSSSHQSNSSHDEFSESGVDLNESMNKTFLQVFQKYKDTLTKNSTPKELMDRLLDTKSPAYDTHTLLEGFSPYLLSTSSKEAFPLNLLFGGTFSNMSSPQVPLDIPGLEKSPSNMMNSMGLLNQMKLLSTNANYLNMMQSKARMPLPPRAMEDEPVYVNAKQYNRILKMREKRQRQQMLNPSYKIRKRQKHKSRVAHANKRQRLKNGRFISKDQLSSNNSDQHPLHHSKSNCSSSNDESLEHNSQLPPLLSLPEPSKEQVNEEI